MRYYLDPSEGEVGLPYKSDEGGHCTFHLVPLGEF